MGKSLKNICSLIFFVILFSNTFAQNAIIKGYVYEKESGNAIQIGRAHV